MHRRKKALAKAQEKLHHAEMKFQVTRRWSRQIQHEVNEFEGRLSQLASMLDGDLPKAIAVMERMLKALESYVTFDSPFAAEQAVADATAKRSIAQPTQEADEEQQAAPTQVEADHAAPEENSTPGGDSASVSGTNPSGIVAASSTDLENVRP